MRRRGPPAGVRLVARSHWLVGVAIFFSIGLLTALVRNWPVIISPDAYWITVGMGVMYASGGTLVWFGLPFGRFLSRLCGLLYLVRPNLGSHLWRIMDSAEYQEHFKGSDKR